MTLDSPPSDVVLNLCDQPRLRPFVVQVEVEPLEQVVRPVPAHRKRVSLTPPSHGVARMAGVLVRVVVAPLTVEPFRVKAVFKKDVVSWKSHVRVDIPVLHSVDDVDRAVIVCECLVEETPLLPVVASRPSQVVTREVRPHTCVVAFEVSLTGIPGVLQVTVQTEASVHSVVHYCASSLHASVAPHEVVYPD